MPDIIIVDEVDVREYFRQQLARKGKNGRKITNRDLADELGVDPSTVNRNAGFLRRDESLATPFYKKLQTRLVAVHLDDFRMEHLRLLGKSQEEARRQQEERERNARVTAKKKAAEEVRRKKAADEEREAAERLMARQLRAEQKRQAKAKDDLKPWQDKLRSAGIVAEDDDELHGDAKELVEAGVADIAYSSDGAAFVALAPDAYEFACGLTASELRAGISARQRMQKDDVPAGLLRPDMIGNRRANFVPHMLYPDSDIFYGSDYGEILEWQALTNSVAHLAVGSLPRFVSPKDVAIFEQLVVLERQSQYTFESSVLGASPDIRLQELERRAIPLQTMQHFRVPLKLLAVLLISALLVWVVWRALQWAAPRVWSFVLGVLSATGEALKSAVFQLATGFNAVISWFIEILPMLGFIVFCAGGVALVVWWVWPKANDKPGTARYRLEFVCIVAAAFGLAVAVLLTITFGESGANFGRLLR